MEFCKAHRFALSHGCWNISTNYSHLVLGTRMISVLSFVVLFCLSPLLCIWPFWWCHHLGTIVQNKECHLFLNSREETDGRWDGDTSYDGVVSKLPQMYHDTFSVSRWYVQNHPHNLFCGYGGRTFGIMIPIFFWYKSGALPKRLAKCEVSMYKRCLHGKAVRRSWRNKPKKVEVKYATSPT